MDVYKYIYMDVYKYIYGLSQSLQSHKCDTPSPCPQLPSPSSVTGAGSRAQLRLSCRAEVMLLWPQPRWRSHWAASAAGPWAPMDSVHNVMLVLHQGTPQARTPGFTRGDLR